METKKIVVICGNPDTDSFTGAVLDRYQVSAEKAGHEVRRFNLGELQFDPILHKGYKEIQQLEPDLVDIQDAIRECDHVVIGYPNWWCTMPAILKGLFDRIWLPGFAFNFNKETKKVDQHLKGKTARVFVISGTHSPLKTWWKFGDFTNEIQYGILDFAGIKTQVSIYGPCEKVNDAKKESWMKEVGNLGTKGA
ncbi:NAD(P)H-dependent oxidoreductase [Candidatus Kaiserbacteria bacterium]|nr:NAD(P)H-dependent oxidoreductase [Candidatus Kaiserbacteria bacterium]USN92125.1 MAG: NAD(P)H-dependent oxidoreductase [Candidatus Nomurabacteria bacterium]